MIPKPWRAGAILILLLTALGFLATRLVFTPVPWPDGSAFYLPGLELWHWPPQWRMHAQAAFVPSYDQANFNLMPALPLLLGFASRIGITELIHPALLIRILSVPALLAWAWLLWSWLMQTLPKGRESRLSAWIAATALALAGLWDPVLRWGTLVVRTETWIGLCWLVCLREMHRWEASEEDPALWSSIAWKISGALALAAYFHFEAIYFVPAAVVGLGISSGWWSRLLGIGARTTLLLSPWLLYAAWHPGLFAEQLQIQFFRLAHHNHWMANPYMVFHSLFVDHGCPSGWPKFFNVAKGIFWLGLAGLTALSLHVTTRLGRFKPKRALLASGVAFACCFYLWATKAEVWFITLCHLAFWPWVGGALLTARSSASLRRLRPAATGLGATSALLALAACFAQARAISPGYTWPVYEGWIDCIERALGPLDARPELRLWQPHVPDILVELSRRHPRWDLTRALDFPAKLPLAYDLGKKVDAILLTRNFNPRPEAYTDYFGPPRPADQVKMSKEEDLPFGPWTQNELEREEPGRRQTLICETGPFWAAVVVRKAD